MQKKEDTTMIRTLHFLTLFTIFLSLISCGRDHGQSRNSATPLGRLNPVIRGTPDKSVGHHITLEAEALEKNFLLSTNFTDSDFPFPKYLASKVVNFKKRGSELFMFGSLLGRSYADTVNDLLLARFPIVNETPEGAITFNFEEGMKLFFFKSSFFVKGMSSIETTYTVIHSYVESVHLRESDIVIEHSVVLDYPEVGTAPLLIRYALASYNPDPKFSTSIPFEPHGEKVGYFQTHPFLVPTVRQEVAPIIKFNSNKFPITYYLTPNIPLPLIQPVKEGILYWNHVLGQEIFKVELLPNTIDPREPGNHILYWIENIEQHNDIAGMADTSVDPLTGEILASRVLLPAHFFKDYLGYAQEYIASNTSNPLDPKEMTPTPSTVPITLKGRVPGGRMHGGHGVPHFHKRHFRQLRKYLDMTKTIHQMNPYKMAYMTRMIVMDLFRSTVSHEIGHVLGLRHNFAGSTQTDLTLENYDQTIRNYIETGEVPEDFVISSTSMDYFPVIVDGLVGAKIRLKHPPMSYDRDAVRFLYLGEGNPLLFSSPYCSDEEAGAFLYQDCNQFDTFANPTAWHYHQMSEMLSYFPSQIVEGYQALEKSLSTTSKKYDDPHEFFQKYPLTPKNDAAILSHYFKRMAQSISQEAKFVQTKNEHFVITGFNYHDYVNQNRELIGQNIAELGGVSKILLEYFDAPQEEGGVASLKVISTIERDITALLKEADKSSMTPAQMAARLSQAGHPALASPHMKAFIARMAEDENKNKIDTEKKNEIINKQVEKYLKVLEKEFLLMGAQVLKDKQFISEDESFVENLTSFVQRILFEKSSDLIDSFDGVDFSLPKFEYASPTSPDSTGDLRQEMVALLTHDFYPERPSYKNEIEQNAKDIFRIHHEEIKSLINHESELSGELYDWLFFERQRFEQLGLKEDDLAPSPSDESATTMIETAAEESPTGADSTKGFTGNPHLDGEETTPPENRPAEESPAGADSTKGFTGNPHLDGEETTPPENRPAEESPAGADSTKGFTGNPHLDGEETTPPENRPAEESPTGADSTKGFTGNPHLD